MAYAFYRTCTVDHTQCGSSDASGFQVKVSLSASDIKTSAHGGTIQHTVTSNGQTVPADLAFFADADLTSVLPFEVESYDGTNGVINAWARTDLSHTVDTVFYMGYDDASVTTFQGDIAGTWPAPYAGVWHLPNGTALAATGSTATPHNGTITGATAVAGVTDGAATFAGGTDKLDFGASADFAFGLLESFTISLWMKTANNATTFLFGVYDGTVPGSDYLFAQLNSPGLQFFLHGGAINHSVNLADDVWHNLTGIYDVSLFQLRLWIDGVQVDLLSSASSQSVPGTPLTAGNDAAGAIPPYVGAMDEIRVYRGVLSDDWILTDYNNQKPSATFLTIGDQTPFGPPPVTGTFPQCLCLNVMGL